MEEIQNDASIRSLLRNHLSMQVQNTAVEQEQFQQMITKGKWGNMILMKKQFELAL